MLFTRGNNLGDDWVSIARDVKYAWVTRDPSRKMEPVAGPMPGWVAVYVSGINQRKLLPWVLSPFMGN